jgi:hypothetical protein
MTGAKLTDVRGTLTPKSREIVDEMRFSGNFGQPNGFGSVLIAQVRRDGEACLSLHYSTGNFGEKLDHFWAVMLTNEQRNALAEFLGAYQPRLWEKTRDGDAQIGSDNGEAEHS